MAISILLQSGCFNMVITDYWHGASLPVQCSVWEIQQNSPPLSSSSDQLVYFAIALTHCLLVGNPPTCDLEKLDKLV